MPFQSRKKPLVLSRSQRQKLAAISRSRTEPLRRIERSRILLGYADGATVSALARRLATNRAKVQRCLDKALQLGVEAALSDLPGRGRRPRIGLQEKAWIQSLACQKPKDLGYAQELWTMRLLAEHVRAHCRERGHPGLERLGRGTVSKILSQAALKPHKVRYYVERRDPQFEARMADVLCVYKQVELLRRGDRRNDPPVAVLSYDEKPGIQALAVTGRELPPSPSLHPEWLRDSEYERLGTVSLLAGIDLLDGQVHGLAADRHRSREFVDFLRLVDGRYPAETRLRLILDNHSAHVSKETRAFLASRPNRFEFVFTPRHGSWLNLVESFFAKMAKTFLRELRVKTKEELKSRLEQYLDEVNRTPVVFRWKHRLDTFSLV